MASISEYPTTRDKAINPADTIQGLALRVPGSEVHDSGFRTQPSRFKVYGLGLGVWG
jgi:hypothetical protein